MMSVEANWSGEYPCLCNGAWTLIVNGVDVSDKIPEDLRNSSMNTYGIYHSWHFDDRMLEEFDFYEDGLTCKDWIEENDYWLSSITDDYDTKLLIYYEISVSDFRNGSCGGCI